MTLQEFAVRQRLTTLGSEFNNIISQLTYELACAFADTDVPENMFRLFGALEGLKLAAQSANTVMAALMLQDPAELSEEWRNIVNGIADDDVAAVTNFVQAVAKLSLQSVINENHEGVTDIDLYILQGSIRCLKALADGANDIVMEVCK